MTDDVLADLERLCSLASPGPWHTESMNVHPGAYLYGPRTPRDLEPDPPGLLRSRPPQVLCYEDAEFIAAARAALPALIAEIRRLRAAQGEAR